MNTPICSPTPWNALTLSLGDIAGGSLGDWTLKACRGREGLIEKLGLNPQEIRLAETYLNRGASQLLVTNVLAARFFGMPLDRAEALIELFDPGGQQAVAQLAANGYADALSFRSALDDVDSRRAAKLSFVDVPHAIDGGYNFIHLPSRLRSLLVFGDTAEFELKTARHASTERPKNLLAAVTYWPSAPQSVIIEVECGALLNVVADTRRQILRTVLKALEFALLRNPDRCAGSLISLLDPSLLIQKKNLQGSRSHWYRRQNGPLRTSATTYGEAWGDLKRCLQTAGYSKGSHVRHHLLGLTEEQVYGSKRVDAQMKKAFYSETSPHFDQVRSLFNLLFSPTMLSRESLAITGTLPPPSLRGVCSVTPMAKLRSSPEFRAIAPHCIAVPAELVPAQLCTSNDTVLTEFYTAEVEALRRDLGDHAIMSGSVGIITRGHDGGAENQWWKPPPPGLPAQMIAIDEQARHPSVRFVDPDSGVITSILSSKGSGLVRALSSKSTVYPKSNKLYRSPFYIRKGGDLLTHYLWGGMVLDEGVEECGHLVAARAILSFVAPKLRHTLPRPGTLSLLTDIPRWRHDGRGSPKFSDAITFQVQHLGRRLYESNQSNSPVIATVFTTCVSSDVRVATLFNEITSGCLKYLAHKRDFLEFRERLRLIVDHFHSVNGVSCKIPEFPKSGRPTDVGAIFDWLRTVHEARGIKASHRLYNRLAGDLFHTIGVIHGAGGHFGGGSMRSTTGDLDGIGFGGATAPRNVSLCGQLHDLSTMFPGWLEPSDQSAADLIPNLHHRFDLVYASATAYLLRRIIFGGQKSWKTIQNHKFGRNQVIGLIQEDPLAKDLRHRANTAARGGDPCDMIVEDALARRYLAGVSKARAVIQEYVTMPAADLSQMLLQLIASDHSG